MICIKWNLYDIFILVSVNSNSDPKYLKWQQQQFLTCAKTPSEHPVSRKRTSTHIYFFGYEGPDSEVCFQKWYPSPFTDASFQDPRVFQPVSIT